MLLAYTAPLFADYETGYQIGYAIGYVLGAMLCPGLVLFVVFCLRGMRSTKLAALWYLGLLVGCGLVLLVAGHTALHPEVLEGESHVVQAPPEPSSVPASDAEPEREQSGSDNTCRLELAVPDHAEVWIDGIRTAQRGPKRAFVSPPLTPEAPSSYKVCVRYTNTQGQRVEDVRIIPVRANERVRVDFNRPSAGQ